MIESRTGTRVRYAETDAMGVAYHGSYIPWLEMARVQLLDDLGLPYRTMEERGFHLPVVDLRCEYRQPCRFDDRLEVIARITERPRARVTLAYEIHCGDRFLARAWTVHAVTDDSGRPVRPPEFFLTALEAAGL
jgi:acyl-CoA thioester hydrolase